MTSKSSILDVIGNTPLVQLCRMDTGLCELFVKLEFLNPSGSIKDRIALTMVEAAEAAGQLKPGDTIVEATAGNTGLALAILAIQKGYKLLLVIPDKMSREKIFNLRAMGAEVLVTRSDVEKGHREYYQDVAKRIASERLDTLYIDQFANPANVQAHETGTGPEIWSQMGHHLDAVVCGVGTGGTLTGIGRFMRTVDAQIEMVLADPEGSVLADYIKTGTIKKSGSWLVEGIGEDFIPDICDLSLVANAWTISDSEAFATARTLLREEGIMAGSSSGTILAAALHYCHQQQQPKRVVALLPDSGTKYFSKLYNDDWMVDHGFIQRNEYDDLRDLIAHPHADHTTITVEAEESLLKALNLMRENAVSQLPVLGSHQKIVGIIDESDILLAVFEQEENFSKLVREAMVQKLEVIDVNTALQSLIPIFNKDHVAIVMQGDKFLGIITRSDLIVHLRKKALM